MCSLINKQLLLTAYAYLFITEQQKGQQGSEALQMEKTGNEQQQAEEKKAAFEEFKANMDAKLAAERQKISNTDKTKVRQFGMKKQAVGSLVKEADSVPALELLLANQSGPAAKWIKEYIVCHYLESRFRELRRKIEVAELRLPTVTLDLEKRQWDDARGQKAKEDILRKMYFTGWFWEDYKGDRDRIGNVWNKHFMNKCSSLDDVGNIYSENVLTRVESFWPPPGFKREYEYIFKKAFGQQEESYTVQFKDIAVGFLEDLKKRPLGNMCFHFGLMFGEIYAKRFAQYGRMGPNDIMDFVHHPKAPRPAEGGTLQTDIETLRKRAYNESGSLAALRETLELHLGNSKSDGLLSVWSHAKPVNGAKPDGGHFWSVEVWKGKCFLSQAFHKKCDEGRSAVGFSFAKWWGMIDKFSLANGEDLDYTLVSPDDALKRGVLGTEAGTAGMDRWERAQKTYGGARGVACNLLVDDLKAGETGEVFGVPKTTWTLDESTYTGGVPDKHLHMWRWRFGGSP